MEELAGKKGEVVLFDSFEELTQSIVNEFTSKSCGKLRLLRKDQPLHHTIHYSMSHMVKGGTLQSEEYLTVKSLAMFLKFIFV